MSKKIRRSVVKANQNSNVKYKNLEMDDRLEKRIEQDQRINKIISKRNEMFYRVW